MQVTSHYLNQWWLVYRRIYVSLGLNELTHWGWVTYICIGKLTIIGSDNGLSPAWRQAIIWTNVGILLIEPLGTNFIEILIEIHTFSFKKMHLKMSSSQAYKFYRRGSPLVQVIAYRNAHAYLKWGMMQILKTKTNKKKMQIFNPLQDLDPLASDIYILTNTSTHTLFIRLTHWGQVTQTCISIITAIGSDSGLSHGRHPAIFCTNGGILLIGPFQTNFSEIGTFSFKKMHLKVSTGKYWSFCLGLNVLTHIIPAIHWQ